MSYEKLVVPATLFAATHWKQIAFTGTAMAIANPTTRAAGKRFGMWGLKRVVKPIAYGHLQAYKNIAVDASRLAKPYARTAGVYTWAVGVGYLAGSIVGTGIAYAGWGKSGAEDALDLYSGKVSWSKYWNTVGRGINEFNRKHSLGPYSN